MPHLILEYSANISQRIDCRVLFSRLHHILVNEGRFNIDSCKSRSVCRDGYFVGAGETQDAFVHLEIRLLEGRSTDLKRRLGQLCLQWLESYFEPSLAKLTLQISVEVSDIVRATYFKFPEGSFIELT